MLKRLLVQEFPERGNVKANETTPALSNDAVLQEAAFVLAISETLLGPESDSIASKNSISLSESSR